MNSNLLKLSSIVQCSVISTIDVKPTTPTPGVYLLSSIETLSPNSVAVYENGAWTHFAPTEGWLIYDRTLHTLKYYNGTAWVAISATKAAAIALGNLDTTTGVVTQTGASTFAKTPFGAAAATDVLQRQHGDARCESG